MFKIKIGAKAIVHGLDDVTKDFPEINQAVMEKLSWFMLKYTKNIVMPAKGIADRTGDLKRRLGFKLLKKSAKIFSKSPHAVIREYGGIITPKNKKYLVFQSGGKTVFAKRTKHEKTMFLYTGITKAFDKEGAEIILDTLKEEVAKRL